MIRIIQLAESDEAVGGGVLIEAAGQRVLVDPGGTYGGANRLPPLLAATERLDAIVLTHAHADHNAGLPAVLAAHPTAPVLATPSTLAMVRILGGMTEQHMAVQARAIPFYEQHMLLPSPADCAWTVRLLPAGHVLGAAMVVFQTPEGCVVCSGDVSLINQYTVRRAARPRQRADVLVLESTYGDREFRPRAHEEARLVAQVRAALERGGHTLLAVPALGAAQEILLTLVRARLLGEFKSAIWVDGMVGPANNVYAHYAPIEYPQLARFIARYGNPFRPDEKLVLAVQEQDKQAILDGPPAIIVTTWPSFRSDPSQFFAAALGAATRHLILVPAGGEARRRLTQVMESGNVRCAVGTYGLMSHADGAALAALAARWGPELVVLNHGHPMAAAALKERLTSSGIRAITATAGQPICWPAVAP